MKRSFIIDTKKKKRRIREFTRKHFKKKGLCEVCGYENPDTTWHHKNYDFPVLRKHLLEVCRPCHDRIENDLKLRALEKNKVKREFRT